MSPGRTLRRQSRFNVYLTFEWALPELACLQWSPIEFPAHLLAVRLRRRDPASRRSLRAHLRAVENAFGRRSDGFPENCRKDIGGAVENGSSCLLGGAVALSEREDVRLHAVGHLRVHGRAELGYKPSARLV